MRLIQWNLRMSMQMTASFLVVCGIVGFLYHYRWGTDLITPPPLPPHVLEPEARGGHLPKACVGFQSDTRQFQHRMDSCPEDYAIYSAFDVGGGNKEGPGQYVPLIALCCPLPADDILLDYHVWDQAERCPDQYVITGGTPNCSENCFVRCTQINTKRYQLGAEQMSYYVWIPEAGRLHGRGLANKIHWEQIPASLRYGIGRVAHHQWKGDACMGVPLGSLLTRKSGKRCDGFFFRTLEYLDGTPVKMLPDCPYIDDPYSRTPACVSSPDEARVVQPYVILE